MPVTLSRPSQSPEVASLRERRMRRGTLADRGRRLRIELVNNMPDTAVFSTQRQFIRLLEEGARAFDVTLELATLGAVERGAEARREMAELYRKPFSGQAAPDAVIVTGAEPRAAELSQEPYWRELTTLFDVARLRTHATLASCLAAHAWAMHCDGVRRKRSARKFSGLYAVESVTRHPLTQGFQPGPTPHSRWNGLEESDLAENGYLTLTRARGAGVDIFVKDEAHLALFFQGHPEYDGDTLAREFRRDVSRALAGAAAPHLPDNYYAPEIAARLAAHVEGMLAGREAPQTPAILMRAPEAEWRARFGVVVGNWLNAIAERKAAANGPTFLRARWGG